MRRGTGGRECGTVGYENDTKDILSGMERAGDAERKAKRPRLQVASLNYNIRQSLGKKNDKLFGQPTISRED